MREFKGRVVTPGTCTAPALVSHGGLNTLASFQKALQFGDKKATCGDQNNPDLYNKQMAGKALCLPRPSAPPPEAWFCTAPAPCIVSLRACCSPTPLILWPLPVLFWLPCGLRA